jgi:nucleoside-diphosphate-sugar epimerase
MIDNRKLLVIGNGFISDNFVFKFKDLYDITVYARNKNIEYEGVSYIYQPVEQLHNLINDFSCIYILFGKSRPSLTDSLSDVIYANVYLVSKVIEFATPTKTKIYFPATSLALSESTKYRTLYSLSHCITIDMIKRSNLPYTICYLHNIYGNLTDKVKKNKMVVDNFIEAYKNNTKVQLINNGLQRRIFTHVSDVVDYMITCINFSREEVNLIKHSRMYAVKELADLLNLNTNNITDPMYSLDDPFIEKLDELHNWAEKIDIKQWILNIKNKI